MIANGRPNFGTSPMRIIHGFPPNYAKIKAALNPGPGAIFCYGPTIYMPGGGDLSPALRAHERVHMLQQGVEIEQWWDLYIDDPAFRLMMEVPAHKAEYEYSTSHGNRPERRRAMKVIAGRLSGKLYGKLITYAAAKKAILEGFNN